jgi:hypothetical protein
MSLPLQIALVFFIGCLLYFVYQTVRYMLWLKDR